MNFYPHHIGDYLTATAHLTWLEDCAYRRLLDVYYSREQAIPGDIAQACRLVRAQSKDERKAVETVLREFFTLGEGWQHGRCDEEIVKAQEAAERARANGKKGGRPPKAKPTRNPEITHPVPVANPEITKSQAPITNTNPITSYSVPIGTGGTPPTDAERVWAFGIPLLTAAGVKESNARSMLGGLCKTHGPQAVADVVQRCAEEGAVAPVAWIQAALRAKPKANAQEALEASNRAVAARFLEKTHAAE